MLGVEEVDEVEDESVAVRLTYSSLTQMKFV